MGNTTRPKPNSPSRPRNVQPILNQIKNRQARLKNESSKLQTVYKNLGKKLNSEAFYESDFIRLEIVKRRAQELLREKKMLDKAYRDTIRYQITHWS